MEKDGSSSKERGGSHSFMEMIEKTRLREVCCMHHSYIWTENYFSLECSELIYFRF